MFLRLRPALCEEAETLSKLKFSAKEARGYDEAFMETFRKSHQVTEVKIAATIHLVAENDNKIIGFIAIRPQGGLLWIDDLAVDPEHENKNVRKLLIQRSEDYARKLGCKALQAEATAELESLFFRCGFKTTDHVPSKIAKRYVALMKKELAEWIVPVEAVNLKFEQRDWSFSIENRERIDTHWQSALEKKPALFNGSLLQLYDWTIEAGKLSGRLSKIDFASFLAWRDWGYPDRTVRNLFGAPIVRSSDNVLIFGVMAPHTANAGKVYPPSGSLDDNDIVDGSRVDLFGSTGRELQEETGLDVRCAEMTGLYAVLDGPRIALAVCLRFKETADELEAAVLRHIAAQDKSELSGIHRIRSEQDINHSKMPSHAVAIIRKTFEESPAKEAS